MNGIPFPNISPEIFAIDLFGIHFALRWYAMGYIVGIVIGWWLMVRLLAARRLWPADTPPMQRAQLDDLATWIVLGVILGGRLGYVVVYDPGQFIDHPGDIVKVWQGGMSFHGGFAGVIVAAWLFSRRNGLPTAQLADLLAIAATPAMLLVRIANFINAELWGRPTTLPWAVIFPGEAAQTCPGFALPCARHPSQLYEAVLEGLILGALLLYLAWRRGWLKRPGALTGLFFLWYGLARFTVELVRQADRQFISPDNPMGHVLRLGDWGLSMGQCLSLPMVLIGAVVLMRARRPG